MSTLTFDEMDLSPEILSGLRDVKYDNPTELQSSVLPPALEGKDLLVNTENGKGIIGSFVIPSLEKVVRSENDRETQILILTPHPDDAQKIDELVWAMGYHAQIECASIDLDGDWDEQEKALSNGVPVIVANPGRLIEILEKNKFIFREISTLVLDRSEEMLSLNLSSQLNSIFKRIISEHQTMLLASEFNDEVQELANSTLEEPEVIGFEAVSSDGELTVEPPSVSQHLEQGYILVPNRMKISTLMAHLDNSPSDRCVIFTASKRGTDRLYRTFRKRGKKATSIHGKLSEEKRKQRLSNFTGNDVQLLLVADISATDLNLNNIKQVINYDVPNDPDEYRYRADLAAGSDSARIVSLVSKQDRGDINQLKDELGQSPKELPLPDKVKQKLKQRKSKSKSKGKKKRGRGKKKRRGGGKKQKEDKLELPRPSYDKLSGGRSGRKDEEESAVVEFFKKLFS